MANAFLACNIPFLFGLLFFAVVMASSKAHTLWSGVSALFMIGGLGITTLLLMFYGVAKLNLTQNSLFMQIATIILVIVLMFLLFFPFLLIAFFFVEGVRLIRKEGFSLTNCLLIGFSLMLAFGLFVLPLLAMNFSTSWINVLFLLFSTLMTFFSIQLAVFVLSAFVNLFHVSKKKNLSQIVVLGSGLFGSEVPPLLQARIKTGIDLQRKNPNALLILSGGQGPGEDLPEGRAMRQWALEHGADPSRTISEEQSRNTEENLLYSSRLFINPQGRTAIVTNRYHVFRALMLGRQMGMPRLYGYGAKTKWYFALNATLREFAAYLSMTRKRQTIWVCIICLLYLFPFIMDLIFR